MKFILIYFLFNYSLSQIVFPFKIRENFVIKYPLPINETKINIKKYLYHILNDYEFISEVEVGIPKQKVEVMFDFFDNYLVIISHTKSTNPFFYNISTTYKEIKQNDPDLKLQVLNPYTINEILHLKNKFYDNLDDFILSKDETSHEFVILFSKVLPKINYQNNDLKYSASNAVEIGLLIDINYNRDHGIYNPFLNEIKEKGFIDKKTYFFYFFEKYGKKFNYNTSLNNAKNSPYYNGLIVFGKYPHELLPNVYNINDLAFIEPFYFSYEYSAIKEIEWGVEFDEIYLEYNNGIKEKSDIYKGVFDFNVEYILAPLHFYDLIKKFFKPLFDDDICFEEENTRNYNRDGKIHRMIYCKYEEFKKDYLETFPKLVFKFKDFDEIFEFTYKDLFKPVYNNKYYLFLLFIKRQSGWKKVSGLPAWYLGRIFMNKYQFVFDGDNKKVGYYKMPIPEGKETPEKTDEIITDDINIEGGKNKPVDIIFIIFFGVILTIIIVAVIIVLYECLKNKKRKKRANELIDEDDYSNEANNPNDEDKAKN